jgi:hypothetical protein
MEARPGELFPTIRAIRRMPDVLHMVSNTTKRLRKECEKWLSARGHRQRVARYIEEHPRDMGNQLHFARMRAWENIYAPDLHEILQAGTQHSEGAECWLALWDVHSRLCTELMSREILDSAQFKVPLLCCVVRALPLLYFWVGNTGNLPPVLRECSGPRV